ncbi:MAG TPA: ABC transporter substrate-binding protein [Candidatus Limnocylindria bacterium]|nr:ABC transporter substrate-binding protein [Candidatus Limnocylindria bacterium]
MRRFRFVAPVLVLSLVLTACPAGGGGDDGGDGGAAEPAGSPGGSPGAAGTEGSIEVTSLWGGAEATAFEAVLTAFEEANPGISVDYTSVRADYATVLNNRLAQGDPPDIAIIPGIGFLRSFARDDLLIPLEELGINREDIEGNYAPGILDVGVVNDELVALMVKLNSKSTIWYKPDSFEEGGYAVPESWEDLVALTEQMKTDGRTPWALGAADSWTLTDWFESIYLRQAGEDAYDTLFSAEGNWTDQTVTDAIATMTEILNDENVAGGIDGALATAFVDGIGLVFSEGGEAEMYYEGGFVGGIALGDVNPDLEIGTGIDFFDFPPINGGGEGAITIGGDVMAAFTTDPGVAEFMEYLTTPEAGTVWAEGGTIISPIQGVDSSVYEVVNELAVKEAEQVANASAVRFDGSDLLPAGTDLGAILQSAIQDPEGVAGALEQFQSEVDSAWQEEEGG